MRRSSLAACRTGGASCRLYRKKWGYPQLTRLSHLETDWNMRNFAPTRFNRHSIRLKGYDYSQPGEYFVTINTHGYERLFGEVIGGEMRLNDLGAIAMNSWINLPHHYPNILLDEFIIMPNHMHGLLIIHDPPPSCTEAPVRAGLRPAHPHEERCPQHDEAAVPPYRAELTPAHLKIDQRSSSLKSIMHGCSSNLRHDEASALPERAGLRPARTTTPARLSEVIRAFKSFSAREINLIRGMPGTPVWHRNYYDRIIRSDREFKNIQQYIIENPLHWAEDRNQRHQTEIDFKKRPATPCPSPPRGTGIRPPERRPGSTDFAHRTRRSQT